jgi:hypothetical protein
VLRLVNWSAPAGEAECSGFGAVAFQLGVICVPAGSRSRASASRRHAARAWNHEAARRYRYRRRVKPRGARVPPYGAEVLRTCSGVESYGADRPARMGWILVSGERHLERRASLALIRSLAAHVRKGARSLNLLRLLRLPGSQTIVPLPGPVSTETVRSLSRAMRLLRRIRREQRPAPPRAHWPCRRARARECR